MWILLGGAGSSLVNLINTVYLLPMLNFRAMFFFGTIAQIISLLILYKFEEKLDVSNLAKFNGIELIKSKENIA